MGREEKVPRMLNVFAHARFAKPGAHEIEGTPGFRQSFVYESYQKMMIMFILDFECTIEQLDGILRRCDSC